MTISHIKEKLRDLVSWLKSREKTTTDIELIELELLREAINTGALTSSDINHRDLLAPTMRRLLKEGKLDELEQILIQYTKKLEK